jgi:hypothetical protein
MHASRLKGLFALALALCTQPASAFLDPPYITPANPHAGEFVSVNFHGGECDVADNGLVWPPPVTQQGNEITIHLTGIHEVNPDWCIFGVGTATIPVGSYAPGSYTLNVERRYTVIGTWVQETLGIIPFTVSAAPQQQPIETPTLNLPGLTALLLMLIGAVLHNLRKHLA